MKVYTNDLIGFVELESYVGNDLTAVNAARVSFDKKSTAITEKDKELLGFLAKAGHHSPFEHIYLNFHVKAPIFVARQWFRHRIASYNEVSLRYTDAKMEFFTPNTTEYLTKRYKAAYDSAMIEYSFIKELLELEGETPKRARELARAVLPTGLYTEFKFSCNMRAAMHFIHLRSDSHAQPEIQAYANIIEDLLVCNIDFEHTVAAFRDAGGIA